MMPSPRSAAFEGTGGLTGYRISFSAPGMTAGTSAAGRPLYPAFQMERHTESPPEIARIVTIILLTILRFSVPLFFRRSRRQECLRSSQRLPRRSAVPFICPVMHALQDEYKNTSVVYAGNTERPAVVDLPGAPALFQNNGASFNKLFLLNYPLIVPSLRPKHFCS